MLEIERSYHCHAAHEIYETVTFVKHGKQL